MKYRTYPNTDIAVSEVGFGLWTTSTGWWGEITDAGAVALLREAAGEHKNALVVNTSSISGKRGEAWLSVYSATKHGVVGWTEAMNKELAPQGIKSSALCPAFVDTPMTEFAKQHVPAEDMIRPQDIAEAVRYLLKVSPACIVPEMMFTRPGDAL